MTDEQRDEIIQYLKEELAAEKPRLDSLSAEYSDLRARLASSEKLLRLLESEKREKTEEQS